MASPDTNGAPNPQHQSLQTRKLLLFSDNDRNMKRTIVSTFTNVTASPQHQSPKELLIAKLNSLLYFLGHIIPIVFEPMREDPLGVGYTNVCFICTLGIYLFCCFMDPWGYLPTIEKFDILVMAVAINGTLAFVGYKIYWAVEGRRERRRLSAEKEEQEMREKEEERKRANEREEKFRMMDRGFLKRV